MSFSSITRQSLLVGGGIGHRSGAVTNDAIRGWVVHNTENRKHHEYGVNYGYKLIADVTEIKLKSNDICYGLNQKQDGGDYCQPKRFIFQPYNLVNFH